MYEIFFPNTSLSIISEKCLFTPIVMPIAKSHKPRQKSRRQVP